MKIYQTHMNINIMTKTTQNGIKNHLTKLNKQNEETKKTLTPYLPKTITTSIIGSKTYSI